VLCKRLLCQIFVDLGHLAETFPWQTYLCCTRPVDRSVVWETNRPSLIAIRAMTKVRFKITASPFQTHYRLSLARAYPWRSQLKRRLRHPELPRTNLLRQDPSLALGRVVPTQILLESIKM